MHERRMSEPMPFLFQRQLGTVRRVISPGTVISPRTVLVMLRRRCAELAECRRLADARLRARRRG
jgi:hypothetical protein